MNTSGLHQEAWPYILTLLPPDFEEAARETGALVRCRNVPNAAALLRLALAYAVSDLSLKDVAAWAHTMEVADITGPGLFYRMRVAERWLAQMLASTLSSDVTPTPSGMAGRLRVVDATVLTGPGSTGTDWRVHADVDLMKGTLRSVEVTDAQGGEGFARFALEPGDIVLGDRGYAHARGIAAVHAAQARVLVRIAPRAIRLCGQDRRVLRLSDLLQAIPPTASKEWPIWVPVPPDDAPKYPGWNLKKAKDWIAARLIAARTRPGEVIWLLTTVPASDLPALQVLRLYRLRWQVELQFKRLKSLLHLDDLASRNGPTARSWILARLLAAALAQRLASPAGPLSPWGYELREAGLHA